ncbi:MAG: asparagine synthase C-terminal domain-containing protein, partial [Planctomycetes bacterium]|nr:asparagine synthase C-terminal domain-containing protein [Planctomycetota bacterium]
FTVNEYERLLRCQDEPVLSSAMLANYKVMSLISRHKTRVVLEGQGADEYLGGYHGMEHSYHADLLRTFRWSRLSSELRAHAHQSDATVASLLATAARRTIPRMVRRALGRPRPFRPAYLRPALAEALTLNGGPAPVRSRFRTEMLSHLTYAYLPFYLRYGDRNAMAFGIETRLPFLDYRLVEYTLALPDEFKISRAVRKWLIREALASRLPEAIRSRTDKIGFQTPQGQWMRGPLRAKITEMFAGDEYRSAAYVDSGHVLGMWERFLDGDATLEQKVFRLFIFELWLRVFDLS